MPSPGAQPKEGYDALDLGRDANGRWLIGTLYTDGSYVVWDAATEQEVAYISPGRQDPADLGGGRAAVINPDGSLTAFDIKNPPPQFQGAPSPAAPTAPAAPAAPDGAGTGTGRYAGAYAGQTTPGRPTDVPFGSTVAPSTWNKAGQGRGEGWGTIGAGTAGIQYGKGVPGFGQAQIDINPADLPHLSNEKVAPGYIPGSGTYNQFRLDTQNQTPRFPGAPMGLFATMPLRSGGTEVVNTRFGLGGTGDPTTGAELQTPDLYVRGTGSPTAMQGDEMWRRMHPGGGGMGGGWDQAYAAAPRYTPGPGASAGFGGSMNAAGYGASGWEYVQPGVARGAGAGGGMGGGGYDPNAYGVGGGGMGGGFFGSTVSSNWGQTAETAGKDYIATLFLRSDTPTGIGTPAWSAPRAMWDGLAQEIAAGRIYIKDPLAWKMLAEQGYTPQNIGGAATGGQNVAPGGGSSTEDAIANGNAAEAAERAAYWAYQQSLLRQGDQRIALEAARDAWAKAYQTAGVTGQFEGADTMAMQQQRHAQGVADAGLTGTYQGQDTMAKINQQNAAAQALLALQAGMKGPRDWAAYQRTFGATPQGLRDVMAAFQGRYQLPTGQGAPAGAQGGQASVAGLAGDILSGTYGNDQQSGGPAVALANPRQADLQNWSRMMPSQREMILGQAEQSGWYGPDYEKVLLGAAPRYAGPSSSSFNFFQS